MLLSICPSEEEELSDGYGLSSHSECYTSRATMIRRRFSIMGESTERLGTHKYVIAYVIIGDCGSGGMV